MSSIEKAMAQKKTSVPSFTLEPPSSLNHQPVHVKKHNLHHLDNSTEVSVGERINLNLENLEQRGFITPKNPKSRIAEEYRLIKRPILKSIFKNEQLDDSPSNLLMVTSALQGEGKTFTAVNLAISIAMEYNHEVLLIDADTIKPETSKIFGIQKKHGLMEILQGTAYESDVILNTNIPSLYVIGSGENHPFATELLASQQMLGFVTNLAKKHPHWVIIFDTPPLLMTTQSSVLAHFMSQIIFVISAGNTLQTAAKEAIAMLDQTEQVVWGVINKSQQSMGSSYSYGYGEKNYD
ncbi:polysaccharide biosynthesis tyrosine autokinase [Candidatus Nitrosacidococcus tergens]|uniref:non-specific protein-tyrosine kinase n=1 Tax=Candidatus Nitrosacidococcus tergens TaxID=553981 RepID=A0A7G1QAT8_9GAMM|nr:polysaccharide biosynthesis tyrosine autokinase [Candidatus Nitrosacidococcus tergens]CAB1276785.1 Protein-tyrosine kinase [Candidatus Nitrosacidococcus tergens]